MYKFVLLAMLLSVALARPERTQSSEDHAKIMEIEKKQNENAQYHFSSSIEDKINGLTNEREENREGLKVTGRYSYSDGFYKRTVSYEADENGYRVTKEEVEPLAGPVVDPEGTATVMSSAHGQQLTYRIQSVVEHDAAKKQ